jgi:hypothetical protein
MSFQAQNDTQIETKVAEETNAIQMSEFEKHIIQCCKATEWELRRFLKKVLTRAGFTIQEDGYKTDRVAKDKRYESVHNMLAVRGENPRVCLVAHTDVCRDHEDNRYSMYGEYSWMLDEDNVSTAKTTTAKSQMSDTKVEPVVKLIEHEGQMRRVIQEKDCKIQVGGDDRLGVAINTWIALNTGYDLGLFFPTDEEIGLKSARACEMQRLKEFDLLCQVDRGNSSHVLVVKIGGQNGIIADYDTCVRLLEIAFDMGKPREPICGLSTDVYALHQRGFAKNAVNMSCGYHNSRGAQKDEYIEVDEARDTMKYVSNIVKDFYLNP